MPTHYHNNLKRPSWWFVHASLAGWGFLPLFIPLMLLFAFQVVNTDPDIEQARIWFTQQHPSPKFWDVSVSPDWANARKVLHQGKKFYEVPLQESTTINFGIGDFNGQLNAQQTAEARTNGKLRIVIAQNGTQYKAFYLQTSGSKTYVDTKGANKVLSTTFDHIEPDFTGVMEYFDMNSKHVDGWYFENGIAKQLVFTYKKENKPTAMDRCLTCTETTTFWQITVSAGGYINTYWEINQTYNCYAPITFYCYDPPFYPPGYYYYPWSDHMLYGIVEPMVAIYQQPAECPCSNTEWSGVWREKSWDILDFYVRTGLKTVLKDIKCRLGSFGYDFNSYSFIKTPENTTMDSENSQAFGNVTVKNQELIRDGPGYCDWHFKVTLTTKAAVIVTFPFEVFTRIHTPVFWFPFEYEDEVHLR